MINWDSLKKEYEEIVSKLSQLFLDQKNRTELQKRSSQLSELLGIHEEVEILESRFAENVDLFKTGEDGIRELAEGENREIEQQLKVANQRLDELLYPGDENDSKSVFLEIRAGAGGQEAALFATDLFRMYSNYALSKNWTVSLVDSNETDIGGHKELIAHIKGKNVYRRMKFESGVHRVQRVPKTEGAGRIHTSTVTVAVLPEVEDVAIDINPQDLRIDVFRSQGAGGQSVNTTDSAVRIVHVPTGLIVTCQDERSQIKNKAKAMKVLRARLFEFERRKKEAEIVKKRKQQIGSGDRSEKVRTYNFPQNRVSDHRINLTLKNLDHVIQGHIDELINPLIEWDVLQRKKEATV